MNISKLIELIPKDYEIKKIKSKYKRTSAFVNTARCLALTKNEHAEEFIDNALTAVDELHKREINKRPRHYANCAESYSIIGSEKTVFAVDAAVSEIMKRKQTSDMHNYDEIVISIAHAGVNLNDIKIVDTAKQLCNTIRDTYNTIPSLCSTAEGYAYFGETEKALELVGIAKNEISKKQMHEGFLIYLTGIIGDTIIKIGKINNNLEIIVDAINMIRVPDMHGELNPLRGVRVAVPAINAIKKITGANAPETLIDLYKNFEYNSLNNICEMIEDDIPGLYAFDLSLNEARMLYLIGEKEKSSEILELMGGYLFGEESGIFYKKNAARVKMALLWEKMDEEKTTEIINRIYDEIKDADANERAVVLSETLSSIQYNST